MTIEQLEAKIREAQKAYYNLDPIMSDQEYDALLDALKTLKPTSEVAIAVGAPVSSTSVWPKVEHEIPMGSLNKATKADEFFAWALKTGAQEFVVTHKIDGSSMELIYESGRLLRCVTRGDGKIGEDVTPNICRVPSIPKTIDFKGKLTVRGEVVMHKNVFQSEYAVDYANPRNTAAGKVRDKKDGGKSCADLTFYAYAVDILHATFTETLAFLRDRGFLTPVAEFCGNAQDINAFFLKTEETRASVPYEIDGMVVQINDTQLFDSLGSLNLRPEGAVAYKFTALAGISRVRDVKWSVGPTGRISPVAIIDPVNIGGVVVTRVSLQNLDTFRELALHEGCMVEVSRRNDTIPFLERKIEESNE